MSSLLLDADVVIHLHAHDVWEPFLRQTTVHIGSIVALETMRFKSIKTAQYSPIQYDSRVKIIHGDVNEIRRIRQCFCPVNGPEIHPGELESIVILREMKNTGLKFCTCDRGAIQAMAMIGLEENGISLEEALIECNVQMPLTKKSWTKTEYQKLVQAGSNNRALGLRQLP